MGINKQARRKNVPTSVEIVYPTTDIAVKLGTYYGYPRCCVNFFIKRLNGYNHLTKQQQAVHGYNGFIPCAKCAKLVTKETVHMLIRNRVCKAKYPSAGAESRRLKFLGFANRTQAQRAHNKEQKKKSEGKIVVHGLVVASKRGPLNKPVICNSVSDAMDYIKNQ